ILLYANSLANDYIFDDIKVIQENESIRSFGAAAGIFRDVFGYTPLEVKGNRIDPSYRPVRFLSYAIDYAITRALFGEFEPNRPPPLIFHLTNILLHAACAGLVFFLARKILPADGPGPALVALLFAAHPVQTEAVTYLSGRRDVLFTLFYLFGALAYVRYRETGRWPAALLCVVAYLLSLFTKEMAVTLPAVLVLLRWPRRGEKGGGWPLLIALFVIAAAFSGWKLLVKNPGGLGSESVGYWGGDPLATLLTIPRVLFHYLGLIVFPLRLSADYSYDAFSPSRSLADPATTWIALAGLAFLAVLVAQAARRGTRIVWLASGWFVLTLLPVLQLFPHPERLAERFLYLPIVGPLLLFVAAILHFAGRRRAAHLAPAIGIVLALLMGGRVLIRNTDWSSPVRLWGSAVDQYPRCARAQAALGAALMERGQYRDALPHLDACLDVIPLDRARHRLRGLSLGALFNRAVCYYEMGDYDAALRDCLLLLDEKDAFGKDLRGQQKAALIYFNLGGIHYQRNEEAEAIRNYQLALRFEASRDLADHMREAHVHLGRIYYNRGEGEKGIAELHRALELTPDHERELRILFDLGEAYRKLGKHADAESIYRRALTIEPGSSDIRYRIAQVRMDTDLHTAEVDLRRLLEDDPGHVAAMYSLADIEFRLGRYREAERRVIQVLANDPHYAPARHLLSGIRYGELDRPKTRIREPALLYRAGERKMDAAKYREALSFFREAIRIEPDHADAFCMAGLCLLLLDDEPRARLAMQGAIQIEEGHPQAREALARLALAEGKPVLAEEHLRAGLAGGDPGTPSASVNRLLLSGILHRRGDTGEAIRILEAARRDGPPRADVHLQVVLFYVQVGRKDEAERVVLEMESIWPDSPEAIRARSALESE
ncbi:MAG: tetratricopeptide repeat protein, partial [Planctomycetota bacterium]|nr:tetratricopeptide repeat protein [Planctomycetota bacterium]